MNVLVTGGAGFIGSALVERLLAGGHRVAVVDDLSSGDRGRVPAQASFFEVDVGAAELDRVFAAAAPRAVVHLAAVSCVAESVRAPGRAAAVNVSGTVNVLGRCAAHGVRRFVFASSGGALYGDSAPLPTPEDWPASPVSPYGTSKASAEARVAAMGRDARMGYAILRYGNVYGPRAGSGRGAGVIPAFCGAVLAGVAPVIHGDGLQERDYVHIDDAVGAALRALAFDGDGVFNIGAGESRTVREVFRAVAAAARYRGGAAFAAAPPGEVRRSRLDVQRARRRLGWTARVAFDDGIARTLRALRGHLPGSRRFSTPRSSRPGVPRSANGRRSRSQGTDRGRANPGAA